MSTSNGEQAPKNMCVVSVEVWWKPPMDDWDLVCLQSALCVESFAMGPSVDNGCSHNALRYR